MKPAMSSNEIACLQKYLDNATNYFEFGMGGSTVLANNTANIIKITCVESDIRWVNKVEDFCKSPKITTHVPGFSAGVLGKPLNRFKKITESEKLLWESYSKTINNTNELYDLILVDGRFRVACGLAAHANIKPSGFLLVHDYSTRKHYHSIEKFYNKIDEVERLAIFQKKKITDNNLLTTTYESFKYDWF